MIFLFTKQSFTSFGHTASREDWQRVFFYVPTPSILYLMQEKRFSRHRFSGASAQFALQYRPELL